MEKSYKPYGFNPTASRAGDSDATVFRGANLMIRGRGRDVYAECYGGSLDLQEDYAGVALTGTISFSTDSRTVTGTATEFQNELALGQTLLTAAGEILKVEEIISATVFTAAETPLSNGAGVIAYRLPVLFEVNHRRGVLLAGNALEFDTGAIIAVGSGTFYLNGAELSGTLTASKQAKIALYDPSGVYAVQNLGLTGEPVGITAEPSNAPSAKTFADTDVETATDSVTITAHGFVNGQKVTLSTDGALPSPLDSLRPYYLIRTDPNTFKFGLTLADTVGTPNPVNLTTASGGGTHTVTPVSKAMPAGARSLLIAKASDSLGTPGFGDPSEKIKVILTAGQGIKLTFPPMDSSADPADPHNAWRIYGSRHGGSETLAAANADSGAWYYVRTVTAEDLGGTAGGTYYLEYLDAEVDADARLATFDNTVPPRASFIASLGGTLVLVSCQGRGTDDFPAGDAPGTSLVPLKSDNSHAAPLVFDSGQRNEVPLSPPETIIGFYTAAGRIYLLTANTLQIAAFTENPFAPISTRPFWKSGFKNPYALCFANDRLYGFTNSPIRSPEDGSDSSVDRAFAAPVKELTYRWHSSRVLVAHDPQNECVCYIYSGAYRNENGFRVSLILPFMLELEAWGLPIVLSDPARDLIVSGAATVAGHLEFLAGGRSGDGESVSVKTYRFDAGVGEVAIDYYAVWQLADDGAEYRPKKVKYPRVTGRFAAGAETGIFAFSAGGQVDTDLLEAGAAGSRTGALALAPSPEVTLYPRFEAEASDAQIYAPGIFGSWDGSGAKDRFDEITLEVIVQGARK